MPKYHPIKGLLPLRRSIPLILAILFVLYLCMWIWHEPIFMPIILLIIFLSWVSGYSYVKKMKEKRLMMAAKREGCDIGTFAKSFDYRKIDTWIIRAVYEELHKFVSTKKIQLPILATDHLKEDLNIDEDMLDDIIMEKIAQRTGRTFEDCEKNPYFDNLNTVSDLVGYFNYQPLENKDAQHLH